MKDIKESAIKKEKRNTEALLKKSEENQRNKFIEIIDEIIDEIVIDECLDIISGLFDIDNN